MLNSLDDARYIAKFTVQMLRKMETINYKGTVLERLRVLGFPLNIFEDIGSKLVPKLKEKFMSIIRSEKTKQDLTYPSDLYLRIMSLYYYRNLDNSEVRRMFYSNVTRERPYLDLTGTSPTRRRPRSKSRSPQRSHGGNSPSTYFDSTPLLSPILRNLRERPTRTVGRRSRSPDSRRWHNRSPSRNTM